MGASNGCQSVDHWNFTFSCSQEPSSRCRSQIHDATEDDHAGDDVVQQVVDEPMQESEPRWTLPPGGQLTVMLFGMAGTGKSSLGNLLAGFDIFGAGDTTRSVTNLQSLLKYETPDSSLILMDTIGLGDSDISEEQVCASIKDVAVSAPHGIDMLLYVMRCGRITDDTVSRLVYLTQYLWGDESVLNLYLVITWATRYVHNAETAEAWLHQQSESDPRFKLIFKLVGENPSRCIFVDVPPLDSDERWHHEVLAKRRLSYDALLQRFCEHPRDLIEPFRHEIYWKKVQAKVQAEQKLLAEKQEEVKRLRLKFKDIMKQQKKDKGMEGMDESFASTDSTSCSTGNVDKKVGKAKTSKLGGSKVAKAKSTPPKAAQQNSEVSIEPVVVKDANDEGREKCKETGIMDKQTSIIDKSRLEDELARATSSMEVAQNILDRKVLEVAQDLKNDSGFEQQVKQHTLKQQGQFSKDTGAKGTSQVSKARSFVSSVGKRFFGGNLTPRSGTPRSSQSSGDKMNTLVACSAQKFATSSLQAPVCIIFDWDDTLCPTWWMHKVLEPLLNQRDISSFKEDLLGHVNKLENVLSVACKVAGHVAILTQATEGWVKQSLRYFDASGVDLEARLKDMKISIYHADLKQAATAMAGAPSNLSVAAKKASMEKILRAHFGDSPKVQWHALSVGDQMAELTALKELCKDQQKRKWIRPICKTLKLPAEPLLEDHGETLQLLASHLPDLTASDYDVDVTLEALVEMSRAA